MAYGTAPKYKLFYLKELYNTCRSNNGEYLIQVFILRMYHNLF
nr:MAG TPA: hypothetical protein [Caudoviricetes sp.]